MANKRDMIVHVVDYRSTEAGNFLKHPPSKSVVVTWVERSMSISAVVSEIKKAVQAAGGGLGSIAVLKLFGHGKPGYMEFGEGLHIDTVDEFYPLQSWMNPNGNGVELHGCNVGAAYIKSDYRNWKFGSYKPRKGERDVGLELIRHLSIILGVAVTAGIDDEFPDPKRNFERRTRTVFPDWQKRTRQRW